jgi:glycosyltransferase involved in cell wall biosynthesis
LPCNNEAGAIPSVLPKIQSIFSQMQQIFGLEAELIIVNDASNDETENLLENFSFAHTVHLKKKSGYGAALRAGIEKASGKWIAFFDLDGTYEPLDLKLFILELQEKGPDLVMGERFSKGTGMPLVRMVGNKFFTYVVNLLFGSNLKDVCTGFRFFHSKHKESVLQISHSGLDFSLALTLWAIQSKLKIAEIPIHYHNRSGKSKLKVLPDGNRFLWTILRAHFSKSLN